MHLAFSYRSGGAGGLGGGPEYAPEIGVAVSHCAAVGGGCWDDVDHACGRQEQAVGVAVAGALPCPRDRWIAARCNPSRAQASPDGGSDCRGGGKDVAREAPGGHALEHPEDGPRGGPEPHQCEADLECARAEAASDARVQVVERQEVCRQGAGCRRPLPQSAGQSPGAERRREEPGPGTRPHPTGVADEKGPGRHHDARLQAPWHHFPVCRARCRHRCGDRTMHEAPPPSRVPALPADHPQQTPKKLDLHLVLEDYATHKHSNVKTWLAKHPRFHLHFTPTSASWLNQVERFFGLITQERIRRGVFTSVPELEAAIRDYLEHHNADPKPFVWTKPAEEILAKVARARKALEQVALGNQALNPLH